MKTKFTKGKWSIFGDWGICKNGWETELIATFEPRGVGQKEGFANAHLIAAAPEMYEEIESDINELKEFILTLKPYSDDWLFYTNKLKRKEGLLAKAGGESC